MSVDVLAHAKEVAAWATDNDDTRYCQSVLVALADRLAAAERVVEAAHEIALPFHDSCDRRCPSRTTLRAALDGYEKAYSSKHSIFEPRDMAETIRTGEWTPEKKAADLNSAKAQDCICHSGSVCGPACRTQHHGGCPDARSGVEK